MQLPSPVGPDPALPSPVGPLSGLASLGSGAIGGVLSVDTNLPISALGSIFGAFAAAAGKWVLQAGIYVGAASSNVVGVKLQVNSAGASGQVGFNGPAGAAATFQQTVNAPNALSAAYASFDVSVANQYLIVSAGLITVGASIDLQGETNGGAVIVLARAGSWIALTKVG